MRKMLIYGTMLLVLASCSLYFRQNNNYAADHYRLDDDERAQKYLKMYGRQKLDFSLVKKNEAYFSFGNNDSFQVFVFSDNGFVYYSSPMPQAMSGSPIATQKLIKNGIFSIDGNRFSKETVAAHPGSVYSIIEEGIIGNDTIFMQRSYQTSGIRNQSTLSDEIILLPKVKVMKLGDDIFIGPTD